MHVGVGFVLPVRLTRMNALLLGWAFVDGDLVGCEAVTMVGVEIVATGGVGLVCPVSSVHVVCPTALPLGMGEEVAVMTGHLTVKIGE